MANPSWLNDTVFYEIYPQSFRDTNADGIGDLNGIIEKLDYVASLGCNGIWLNPCFESSFFDAGYDITDYMRVAPRYGTNEDLKRLFDEAHARGIRVILDLVPGHTSIMHPWFRQSQRAKKNEYTDRYVWSDSTWTDFTGAAGVTGSIRGMFERDGCCAVNYYSIQPALNYGFARVTAPWQQPVDAPGPMATREAMKDIMRFWMGMGCDGFRVDMAGTLVKNDDGREATIRLWQDFRAFMDAEFPDCCLLSEWGDPSQSLRGGFDMDFLMQVGPTHYMDLFRAEEPFFSRRGRGSVAGFIAAYRANMAATNGKGLMCIPSSNHDMTRVSEKLDAKEIRLAFAFLLSMPGAPFIYYGDEIGMRYLAGIDSVEGGFERTGSRSPMQWSAASNAGFSAAKPDDLYIMIDPDKARPTVAAQEADPDSLLNTVRALAKTRHQHPALQSRGGIEFLTEGYPLVYTRACDTEKVLVIINPAAREETCEIGVREAGEAFFSIGEKASLTDGRLTAPAESVTFFRI